MSIIQSGKHHMAEISAGQGGTLTTREVRGFLWAMDAKSELDDLALRLLPSLLWLAEEEVEMAIVAKRR